MAQGLVRGDMRKVFLGIVVSDYSHPEMSIHFGRPLIEFGSLFIAGSEKTGSRDLRFQEL
jgi:hypothetical protein